MKNKISLVLTAAISGAGAFPLYAIKPTNSHRAGAYDEQEQLAKFEISEGFVIELVASEDNGLINPIDLTFDDAGRLWIQSSSNDLLKLFQETLIYIIDLSINSEHSINNGDIIICHEQLL